MTREPIPNCPVGETPIRDRAWTEGQITDMHREGFEQWACEEYSEFIKLLGVSELFSMSESDGQYDQDWLQESWQGWQAAMRYRDEKENGDGSL